MIDKTTKKGDCLVQRELEDLVTDLKSTLITKRLKAVKSLGKLRTPLAIDPLREVLGDRSKEVRCAVVEAIAWITPANLHEFIQPLSRDRSADVRLRVAHALALSDHADAIKGLFDLFQDPKDDVANMAARCLANKPKAALARLIRQFGDKSWKVRARSSMAVVRMGKAAGEALKNSLEDPDSNVRFWGATSIGRLRNKMLVPDLLKKLGDPNEGVRIASLRALHEIGDPTVVPKLFDALSQPSEQVREVIYSILKGFGAHSIPFLMESLSNEFWMGRALAARALIEMGSDAVLPLTAALEGQDKERRFWAIKILGQMREASAFPELKKFLSDSDSEIRMSAVQAHGDFMNPESIPLLIERFLDPSWVVRQEAHRSLIKFKQKAVPYLLKALDSVEEDVKYWALRSIGDIRPQGLFPTLEKLLKDHSWNIRRATSEVLGRYGEDALLELTNLATEADSEVKYWALQSLGQIGSNISLPLLFRSLEDPSEAIRNSAQKALSNYGTAIIDDLLALLKSDKRRMLESVVSTLQRMPAEIVVPRLCHFLGKYDEHVSYWIRRTLVAFSNPARKALKALLESKSSEIRRQAILALGDVGVAEDAEIIIPHLKDEHWPARVAASETLGKLGNVEAVEPLINVLDDEDEDLVLAALNSLGAICDDRAVPGLLGLLSRESWTLKNRVITILGKMKVRRAVPELLKLYDEDHIDLKIPIVKALGEIAHVDSLKPLRERFSRETDPELRVAFIDAFGNIDNPTLFPELINLAKSENSWEERRAAIKSLGKMKAAEAKGILLEFLRDPDPYISREALVSLRAILTQNEFKDMEERLLASRKRQEQFQAHFQGGMQHMRVGAMVEAERELKSALKINAKAAYVYSALGNLYYKTGKLIDATKAYIMATTVEPRDLTLKMNLGMVFYRRRAFKEALEVFQAIRKLSEPTSQQASYSEKMIEKILIESKRTPVI